MIFNIFSNNLTAEIAEELKGYDAEWFSIWTNEQTLLKYLSKIAEYN